jgi:methylmalonyl-CoA epimerase
MKVKKIDHVAVMVKDLEQAGKLFSELFETEFTGHDVNEADVRNLMSPLGIELVTPLTPDGPSAKSLERRGEGLMMLSLEVSNLKEAVAEMESRGIRRIGGIGDKIALFHPKDMHGVMIELKEV